MSADRSDRFVGVPSDYLIGPKPPNPGIVIDVDGDGETTAMVRDGVWSSDDHGLLEMLNLRQQYTTFTDDTSLASDAISFLGIQCAEGDAIPKHYRMNGVDYSKSTSKREAEGVKVMMEKFEPNVCEKLKFYVYLYSDPRTGKPFYVGQGQKNRVFAHLSEEKECPKVSMLEELRLLDRTPIIEILRYGLTKDEALLVEAAAIDLLHLDNLTNEVCGHGSNECGRGRVEDIAATLGAEPLLIEKEDSVILINIARNFRYGMSPQAIYDVTRSAWKVGKKREKAKYAFAVFERVVREVFEVAGWVEGGTTMRSTDPNGRHEPIPDRYEFVGQVAEDEVRRKYVGKNVGNYMVPGSQNPIKYVNCGKGGETGADEVVEA